MITVMYPVANLAIESAIHGHSERSRNANGEYPNTPAAASQLATVGPNAKAHCMNGLCSTPARLFDLWSYR
jgi:hypothetical protein